MVAIFSNAALLCKNFVAWFLLNLHTFRDCKDCSYWIVMKELKFKLEMKDFTAVIFSQTNYFSSDLELQFLRHVYKEEISKQGRNF